MKSTAEKSISIIMFLMDFFSNPAFIIVLIITAIIQALIVQFGNLAFMTSGLDGPLWGISIAISSSVLLWGLLIRLIKVPLEDWEKVTPEVE